MKIIQKIKNWLKFKFLVLDETVQGFKPQATKECTRDAATRKRVAAAFKAQEQQMNIRVMKPHDPSCQDPLTCKRRRCFKVTPDKIVSDSYEVTKK